MIQNSEILTLSTEEALSLETILDHILPLETLHSLITLQILVAYFSFTIVAILNLINVISKIMLQYKVASEESKTKAILKLITQP